MFQLNSKSWGTKSAIVLTHKDTALVLWGHPHPILHLQCMWIVFGRVVCAESNPHCKCSDPQLLEPDWGQSTPHLHSQVTATQSKHYLAELRKERKEVIVINCAYTVEPTYVCVLCKAATHLLLHLQLGTYANLASSPGHSHVFNSACNIENKGVASGQGYTNSATSLL